MCDGGASSALPRRNLESGWQFLGATFTSASSVPGCCLALLPLLPCPWSAAGAFAVIMQERGTAEVLGAAGATQVATASNEGDAHRARCKDAADAAASLGVWARRVERVLAGHAVEHSTHVLLSGDGVGRIAAAERELAVGGEGGDPDLQAVAWPVGRCRLRRCLRPACTRQR